MKAYRIDLTPDDNGTFLVTCPALPEVTTFGDTPEACEANARDAIEEALAARIARGAEIPEPDAPRVFVSHAADDMITNEAVKVFRAQLRAMPELKIELYRRLVGAGITRAELARRLDWNRTSVDRLFKLDHTSRLDQIEAAAGALGFGINAELVELRPTKTAPSAYPTARPN